MTDPDGSGSNGSIDPDESGCANVPDAPAEPDVPSDPVEAVLSAYRLKDERRTGWQLRGVTDPETVAAHSWGVAYLCLVFGDRIAAELTDGNDGVDLDHALGLAVVHDVAEAETGDLPTRADASADSPTPTEKTAAERDAMDALADPLPDRVRDAWDEYESRDTPEAILVKELDLVDTCLQALAYERADRYEPAAGEPDAFREYDALDEFFVTTERRLRTRAGRDLVARIRRRYETARDGDDTAAGRHSAEDDE